MMKSKRGLGAVGWVLIVIVLVAIGIGAYIWFAGSGGASIGGIPQPPALPSG